MDDFIYIYHHAVVKRVFHVDASAILFMVVFMSDSCICRLMYNSLIPNLDI